MQKFGYEVLQRGLSYDTKKGFKGLLLINN